MVGVSPPPAPPRFVHVVRIVFLCRYGVARLSVVPSPASRGAFPPPPSPRPQGRWSASPPSPLPPSRLPFPGEAGGGTGLRPGFSTWPKLRPIFSFQQLNFYIIIFNANLSIAAGGQSERAA
jgi:hypothetical protein